MSRMCKFTFGRLATAHGVWMDDLGVGVVTVEQHADLLDQAEIVQRMNGGPE